MCVCVSGLVCVHERRKVERLKKKKGLRGATPNRGEEEKEEREARKAPLMYNLSQTPITPSRMLKKSTNLTVFEIDLTPVHPLDPNPNLSSKAGLPTSREPSL